MNIDDLILVSVDDHVVEPPDMFENHLTPEYKPKAPRIVKSRNGEDMWEYEGQLRPNVGLNAVAGRPPEEYGYEPTSYDQMRRGCYDVHERIRDMNVNGVLASMCFGSFPSFCGKLWATAKDKKIARVMLQAYNDWHIDEWCAAYPGRFIPLAQVPLWNIDLMVQEVRRVAGKGCHAVTLPENPTCVGLPSVHDEAWDPFWKACCETATLVCMHIGSAGSPAPPSMDAPVETIMAGVPINCFHASVDLVFSRALRKFPDLRIALSEGGIGWIPYFLDRIDYLYERHHAWTRQDFGNEKPSDVFRRHFLTCFIDDPTGIKLRHEIGVERISWECDYPHSDSTWPKAPERLMRNLDGVPDEEIDEMTHLNAMRWFQLDAFAAMGGRDNCTVGALRAQAKDVDLSLLRGKGGKPPTEGAQRTVTAGDVLRQLATALDGQTTAKSL
jgi:predicted TIM-barrel fold metal-dependent hydrolase